MIRILLALTACLMITGAGHAQDARATAEAWLRAYEAQDQDAMRALLTEDSRFVDPTSFDRPEVTERIEWTGPDAILSGVAAWGASAGEYTVSRTFEASNRVVFEAEMRVTYGEDENTVSFIYPIVTIITVEDGHVAEHRDYTDFDGMRRAED